MLLLLITIIATQNRILYSLAIVHNILSAITPFFDALSLSQQHWTNKIIGDTIALTKSDTSTRTLLKTNTNNALFAHFSLQQLCGCSLYYQIVIAPFPKVPIGGHHQQFRSPLIPLHSLLHILTTFSITLPPFYTANTTIRTYPN